MRKECLKPLLGLLTIGSLFLGCDSLFDPADKTTKPETLYVKFMNSTGSAFTITDIQLIPMGPAGTVDGAPVGTWSGNILTSGQTLAPGAHAFFTLEIPGGHWSQFRLGVLDEGGVHVMLHEQPGYQGDGMRCSITHWGSDERSVDVTVVRDVSSGQITVSGYGDWAGIDG